MKNCFRLLLVVTSLITAAWQAAAQSPNDNFANAWALSGIVATTNGNTAQATKESGEPNHAGNQGGRSVWFRWVAPTNGLTQIDTGGSAFNTLLAVYTGNAVSTLT